MPWQLQYVQRPASRSHKPAWDILHWFLQVLHTHLLTIAQQTTGTNAGWLSNQRNSVSTGNAVTPLNIKAIIKNMISSRILVIKFIVVFGVYRV